MAFERNKKAKNPNHRQMSIANMEHEILKENEKALKLLDELEANYRGVVEKVEAKKFVKKSRVFIPVPTPCPERIKREKETQELLLFLEKLKRKRFFFFWFS